MKSSPVPDCSVWPIEYSGSDGVTCAIRLQKALWLSSWSLFPFLEHLLWGKSAAMSWGHSGSPVEGPLLPARKWKPANNHSSELKPLSWAPPGSLTSRHCERVHLLSQATEFGAICYAAIDNWYKFLFLSTYHNSLRMASNCYLIPQLTDE